MAYADYLLKIGNTSLNPYIAFSSYKCWPDQRTDVDSGVTTADGVLHRTVLEHTRSKIEFNTPHLPFVTMEALMALIESAYIDSQQRKLSLDYYITGIGTYQTGVFYLVQPEFSIYSAANGIRMYMPTRFAFVEY